MIHLQLAFVNAELGSRVTPKDCLLVSRYFLLESGIALGGAHGIPPESIQLRHNTLVSGHNFVKGDNNLVGGGLP